LGPTGRLGRSTGALFRASGANDTVHVNARREAPVSTAIGSMTTTGAIAMTKNTHQNLRR
jgi:hypothetical protein